MSRRERDPSLSGRLSRVLADFSIALARTLGSSQIPEYRHNARALDSHLTACAVSLTRGAVSRRIQYSKIQYYTVKAIGFYGVRNAYSRILPDIRKSRLRGKRRGRRRRGRRRRRRRWIPRASTSISTLLAPRRGSRKQTASCRLSSPWCTHTNSRGSNKFGGMMKRRESERKNRELARPFAGFPARKYRRTYVEWRADSLGGRGKMKSNLPLPGVPVW